MLSLKAFLGLDGSGFELGIKRAQSVAKKFSNDLGKEAGGRLKQFLTLAAAEEGVRRLITYGSRVADLSEELGISTTALQEWEGAANLAGAKAENVSKFFEGLAVARDKALSGDASTLDAFKDFGISPADLASMRLEDLGKKVGDAVKEGDAQKLIASLKEIGGKGAAGLIATFKSGLDEGFKNTSIIPPEKIAELDALGDRFTSLGKSLIVAFSPFVIWLGKQLDNIVTFSQYIGTAFSTMAKGILHGRFSASDDDKAKLDKIITDWEKRNSPKPPETPTGAGAGGGSAKPKQGQMPIDNADEFFRKPEYAKINANALQQMGALIRTQPNLDYGFKTVQELKAMGLTVKEFYNLAKSIRNRPPAGFTGASNDGPRGVRFD